MASAVRSTAVFPSRGAVPGLVRIIQAYTQLRIISRVLRPAYTRTNYLTESRGRVSG